MNASRTNCFSIELARIRISNALTSAQHCFKLRSAVQAVETFHRWLTIVQIGRVLIQMLAVKADPAALAQAAAWRKEPYLTAGMVNRPSLLEYRAGRSVAPQRAEIRPLPTRSDDDQGGSHRQ